MLREIMQAFGLAKIVKSGKELSDYQRKVEDKEYKTKRLEEEMHKAIQEVKKSVERQKTVLFGIGQDSKKGIDDAEIALQTLRAILNRSLGEKSNDN